MPAVTVRLPATVSLIPRVACRRSVDRQVVEGRGPRAPIDWTPESVEDNRAALVPAVKVEAVPLVKLPPIVSVPVAKVMIGLRHHPSHRSW